MFPLAIWYRWTEDEQVALYFSTDDSMDGREVLDYYRTSSNWIFCFRC